VLSTERITPAVIPPGAFDPPAGWTLVRGAMQPARASLASAGIVLRHFGGPIINHPRIRAYFWGQTFSSTPEHEATSMQLLLPLRRAFEPDYAAGLAQYDVGTGRLEAWRFVNSDPPSWAGSVGFVVALAEFIAARSFSGEGPMFWFTVGGDDPLYAVYIPH